MNQNRREFFKRSAAAGALVTVPYVFANAAKVIPKEDGKQTVAAIGVGGSRGAFSQGGNIARQAAGIGRLMLCAMLTRSIALNLMPRSTTNWRCTAIIARCSSASS